jgi:hypothetical protein
MTDQDLVAALNETEAERVRWMTAALTAGNEIATLKAQVNCLREALDNLSRMSDCTVTDMKIIARALVATQEQCLAEVKAKAIRTAIHIMADSGTFQGFMITRKQSEDTSRYDQWRGLTIDEAKEVEAALLVVANNILEQAK